MARNFLGGHAGTLLGILVLVGVALGPLAAVTHAAPQLQDAPQGIVVSIDEPTHRSGTSSSRLLVRGWAANPASPVGTGVGRVDLYLDAGPDQGGYYLGRATYGEHRPDVAAALGPQFLASGWTKTLDVPRGPHTFVAVAAPSGPAPQAIVPGVSSIHATVGGPAGLTARGCGAGGYCTTAEGQGGGRAGVSGLDPMYHGNLYVGTGAFGHGDTTPPYGWWDANLEAMMPLLVLWAMMDYPRAQWFYGQAHRPYDQNLLTTLATQGILATPLGACFGPNFGGMGLLSLSTVGGYQFGFPYVGPIGGTLTGAGAGLSGTYYGGPTTQGVPLGVPFPGTVRLGSLFAGGQTLGSNVSFTTLTRAFGGDASGPGGVGGAFSSSYGGSYPGSWGSESLFPTQCLNSL
jgi:hypothetical protein